MISRNDVQSIYFGIHNELAHDLHWNAMVICVKRSENPVESMIKDENIETCTMSHKSTLFRRGYREYGKFQEEKNDVIGND